MQDARILHMGWLRDLMKLSEPPMPSFGQLAAACLEHSEWPANAELKARSLATLFSKLDRGQDTDWLRDRAEVQLVLSRLLGRPLGDVRTALGESPQRPDGRLLRFTDARFARELDLAREDLPPGIPAHVLCPPLWGPSFWVADSGSGRTLVGLWLRARGLAHFSTVRERGELKRLPRYGSLFVELSCELTLSAEDIAGLGGNRRPLCIAGAQLPVNDRLTQVVSPPIDEYLRDLADWLEDRLDERGEFDAERAEQWVRRVALPHGAISRWGDVFGLLGMLDEAKPRSLHGRTLDELAEAFVRRRIKEAALDTSWGPKVAEHAYRALRHAAARCLVQSGARLESPHSLERWSELVTTESAGAEDREWLVHALRRGTGPGLNRRELARAAEQLPPGGYQLARSMTLARLLRPASDRGHPLEETEFVLGPLWLTSVLAARAAGDALDLSPSDWGQALLEPQRTESLEQALTARVHAGHFQPIEALVDAMDDGQPGLVAALDAAIRAAARAELNGRNLPEELVHGLLELACENLLVVGGELRPLLAIGSASGWRACLAVLTREHPLPLRRLDPHRTADASISAQFAASCVELALTSSLSEGLKLLQIAEELTPAGTDSRPLLLRLAARLTASENATGDNDGSVFTELSACSPGVLGLAVELAKLRHGDQALTAFWTRLPSEALDHLTDEDLVRKLWLRCPSSVLIARLEGQLSVSWSSLLPHHFAAVFESQCALPIAAAGHCPLDAAADALGLGSPSTSFAPGALHALLLRAPGRLLRPLLAQLERASEAAAALILSEIPAEAVALACTGLPATPVLLSWPTSRLDAVRSWLVLGITSRVPEYHQCFLRLRELESAIWPLGR